MPHHARVEFGRRVRVGGLAPRFDRSTCTLYRSESKARSDPLLDEPMVLLEDVVQMRRGPAATVTTKFSDLLQLGDRTPFRNCPGAAYTPPQDKTPLRLEQLRLTGPRSLPSGKSRPDTGLEITLADESGVGAFAVPGNPEKGDE